MLRMSLEQLQRLYMLRAQRKGIREIARILKKAPSTVSRELSQKRPRGFWRWDCWSKARYSFEQRKHHYRKARQRLRLKSPKLREYVEEQLADHVSPELISLRLKHLKGELQISHQAIYEWIYHDRSNLKDCLVRKGKRGTRGGKRGKKRVIEGRRSIEHRLSIVANRARFGDWEGDTVVSRKCKPCVIGIRERKSRFIQFYKIPDATARSGFNGFLTAFRDIPSELRHTLTLDNGGENARHFQLEERLKLQVYFCHPYASWERGSIENANGFLRRYFPKGTDFRNVSSQQIAAVVAKHNHRPMKCLKGRTPFEVFMEQKESHRKLYRAA